MHVQPEEAQELIKGLRVIVVDDVLDSRDLVEMYLKAKQAEVKAVSCAKDALKLVEKFQPELVISDIYMPEENGYWLIEQLNTVNKESKTYIPAIALTAAAKEEEKKQIIAAGYDGYITKPFMFEDLTTIITQLIVKNKLVKKKL